jgi:hypothetical protein
MAHTRSHGHPARFYSMIFHIVSLEICFPPLSRYNLERLSKMVNRADAFLCPINVDVRSSIKNPRAFSWHQLTSSQHRPIVTLRTKRPLYSTTLHSLPIDLAMLPQRAALRPLQRFSARHPPTRVIRRKLATGPESSINAADNAFNRERAAVKAHAKESSGKCGRIYGAWKHTAG